MASKADVSSSLDAKLAHIDQLDYYALFDVPKDAPFSDIKKKYYVLALRYHPDKNPGDAVAEHYFKRVNEAYQVLSDDAKRRMYDEEGFVDEAVIAADPRFIFKRMFGGEAFDDIIGDFIFSGILYDFVQEGGADEEGSSHESAPKAIECEKMVAGAASSSTEHVSSFSSTTPSTEATAANRESSFFNKQRMQKYEKEFAERVTHLIAKLLAKIGDFEIATPAPFIEKIRREASTLSQEPNAKKLLAAIGYVYYTKAKQTQGKYKFFGIPSFFTGLSDGGHIVKKYFEMGKSLKKLSDSVKSCGITAPSTHTIKSSSGSPKTVTTEAPTPKNTEQAASSGDNLPLNANHDAEDSSSPCEVELDSATTDYLMKFLANVTCLDVETAVRKVCDDIFSSKTISKAEVLRRCAAVKIIGKIYVETSKGIPEQDFPFF